MNAVDLPRGEMNADFGPIKKRAHYMDIYSWPSRKGIKKSVSARRQLPRKVRTLADLGK